MGSIVSCCHSVPSISSRYLSEENPEFDIDIDDNNNNNNGVIDRQLSFESSKSTKSNSSVKSFKSYKSYDKMTLIHTVRFSKESKLHDGISLKYKIYLIFVIDCFGKHNMSKYHEKIENKMSSIVSHTENNSHTKCRPLTDESNPVTEKDDFLKENNCRDNQYKIKSNSCSNLNNEKMKIMDEEYLNNKSKEKYILTSRPYIIIPEAAWLKVVPTYYISTLQLLFNLCQRHSIAMRRLYKNSIPILSQGGSVLSITNSKNDIMIIKRVSEFTEKKFIELRVAFIEKRAIRIIIKKVYEYCNIKKTYPTIMNDGFYNNNSSNRYVLKNDKFIIKH